MSGRYPDLAGKVAVVTGGSRGIGAETSRALAANGVKVLVNGRDRQALDAVVASITDVGGHAVGAPGDVTDPEVVNQLRRTVESAFGPVDILVPFAGGQGTLIPTAQLTLDQWRATLDSDLTSTFLAVNAFLPSMIERRTGAVITMASTAGRLPGRTSIAYAAAKAGVLMFTRHLAAEVGHHGIRINALAPSAIENDRLRRATTDEQRRDLANHFPLGRIGQPDDVAQAVLFLASDASGWITGVTLDITGGRVIL